jgi:hypothetical protein
MFALVWNPHMFHVITMLPSRVSFKVSWFVDENLAPLVEKFFLAR